MSSKWSMNAPPPGSAEKPLLLFLRFHPTAERMSPTPPHDVAPFMLVHHMPAVRAYATHLGILRSQFLMRIYYGQLYRVRARRRAARLHRVARRGEPHRRRPAVQAPEMVRAVPRIVIVAVLRRVRLPPVHGDLLAVVQILRKILILIIANHYGLVLLPVARVRELPVAEFAVERAVHIVVAAGTRRDSDRRARGNRHSHPRVVLADVVAKRQVHDGAILAHGAARGAAGGNARGRTGAAAHGGHSAGTRSRCHSAAQGFRRAAR